MKFGPVSITDAEGSVLAHSVQTAAGRLRKGTVLGPEDVAAIAAAGLQTVTVARLDPDDVDEDTAAAALAERLAGTGVRVTEAFTGRVNLIADAAGVARIDADAILALNSIDPGVTVATVPDYSRVARDMMIATVKIIPYAVSARTLDWALSAIGRPSVAISEAVISTADLVLTRADNLTEKALAKGERVVRDRLAALGVALGRTRTVPHRTDEVAAALRQSEAPLILMLGASATSDVADVCPAALVQAGGSVHRFGMPVDPGNLLFLGDLIGRPVIGLPGCARSPALNGADWVLERLVCGIEVTDADIAAMGVGGLLKEIPIRPQPRAIRDLASAEPVFEIVLLAAGSSRRMGGRDKLLEPVDGRPLLAQVANQAMRSGAAAVHVVLPADHGPRQGAIAGMDVNTVVAADAAEGMAASLRAGLGAISPGTDGVIVMLADMPDVVSADLDALMSAYDPLGGREICRAVSASGKVGHPVLFGRRFFESLSELSGDTGAREVVQAGSEFVVDVPTLGEGAVTDLDTPEAWEAYRARNAS